MSSDQYTLQDPSKQYANFQTSAQYQEGPGLDTELENRPEAVAIAFAREGADVALSYLPEEEQDAQRIVELIQKAGRKAIPLPGDLTDVSYCRNLVKQAVEGLGGLRDHQGLDQHLLQGAGPAAGTQRHPGKRGRARPGVDAAADRRWPAHGAAARGVPLG